MPSGDEPVAAITRRHLQRLRQMYRSAGWPFQDVLEVELLAAGLLARVPAAQGGDTLRVTDAGLRAIRDGAVGNRQALSAHEALVQRVAQAQRAAGRLVWRGIALRVPLPKSEENVASALEESAQTAIESIVNEAAPQAPRTRWAVAQPDVFSVRHTSVEAYLEPVVHEIKVSRADLLSDLRRPHKRAAYLQMGGACWYVLGLDARGRPIAQPEEVPPECGVLQWDGERLHALRRAPQRAFERLPFGTWMALARATPWVGEEETAQQPLEAPDDGVPGAGGPAAG